jgi:copper chaperone CopZ
MFRSITFEVIGSQQLVCVGCEERVEDLLKDLEGVSRVRAHAQATYRGAVRHGEAGC